MIRSIGILSVLALQVLSYIGLTQKPAHQQSSLTGVQILVIEKGGQEKTERNHFA